MSSMFLSLASDEVVGLHLEALLYKIDFTFLGGWISLRDMHL